MTVPEACEAYLRELEARNARPATCEAYRSLFRQLESHARQTGIGRLNELNSAVLRNWREGWEHAPSTQRKRLAQLKPFFSFARTQGWISTSPLKGIRPPKAVSRPTMPLSLAEMRALLQTASDRPREQALFLVMRYSGLAIRDAATLARTSLQASGELVLRRAKTGELVTVLLPVEALAALEAVAEPRCAHYFWTGASAPSTAAKYWRERLKNVASAAGVEGFHPHRLRDTFAIEMLLAGVSMEDVSTLLGHSSVRTTELYYAPWCSARRKRLASIVRKVHQRDPLLLEFTPKKPAGGVTSPPAEADLASNAESKSTRCAYG